MPESLSPGGYNEDRGNGELSVELRVEGLRIHALDQIKTSERDAKQSLAAIKIAMEKLQEAKRIEKDEERKSEIDRVITSLEGDAEGIRGVVADYARMIHEIEGLS